MTQSGNDVVLPPPQPQDNAKAKASSLADSDLETVAAEHDTFEDALDNASVRSLTKRTLSTSKSTSPVADSHDATERASTPSGKADVAESVELEAKRKSRRTSSPLSTRISNSSNLDNVNLDDNSSTKSQEHQNPVGKDQANKSLSLNSITSALPSMPWSPATDSSAKSPGTSTNTTVPQPSVTASHPQPPSRKLTSPFSWLSRNAPSKEKDSQTSPPARSPRRDTTSSVATLTSNPEMMLSKLEEEKAGANASSGANRESLKDRFKALRLREESVAQNGDGDKTRSSTLGVDNQGDDAVAIDKPPLSPVPAPNNQLAPGTVSGINAGPSAMPDTQVDWDLWQSVVYEGPAAVARTSAEELNKAIATGIPNAIRGVIWQVLAQSKNESLEAVYKDLVARGTDKDKDRNSNSTTASIASNGNLSAHSIDGTLSSASSTHSGQSSPKVDKGTEPTAKAQSTSTAERKKKTKEDAAALQKLEKTIRRDLGAPYALYDEGVGYAQGMNFLIMPLLFNMAEQEAFCLLVRLMNQYHLRELFVQDMPGLHLHLYQFERLLEDVEPALYCHLHRRGISPHLYATQWFLTLFAYRFPLQLVLRIYDLIFSEGLSAVLRFGIVLMQKNAATLLSIADMQQLTTYLKDKLFDVYIDKDPSQGSILENGFFGSSSSSIDKEVYRADQLIRDACEVKLTPEALKMYTIEWEEKTKTERDRETELQDLRTANQSYAIKIRKLEERVEVCDHEQTAMATEMVHTKVENEELRDENESLKGQVRELRVVIEKQPLEIEQNWQLERDDLMKRNEKVHEENQKLEKEMGELEEELVQTKMRYAEINSQHEALSRKWSDLKRQFA
ncbi:hypothetical protein CDD82_2081 [Ophiocordyceps australis]|uniref:GTPase-activating protein GYP5 n=1 Tax=Ophiocordyceps australis TaxID=1399860 RepID=A0A2C5Y622_9HYPO|nr:hypothetical protein CDD82_2081 [Ophiocordyceps australis]